MNTQSAAQAVEALISEYGKLIFHTIYGLTGDWEDSQDLTQDTFYQALKSIDAARAKSGELFQARAWLLRIALNTVLMQRRRRNIFRFIPISRLQKREEPAGEQESGFASTLDDISERAAAVQPIGFGANEQNNPETLVIERDGVKRALARLSEPLRICLVLSTIGQFSSSEIARMLDLQEAAVRQRLARARKQFQQAYLQETGEEVFDSTSDAVTFRPSSGSTESDQHSTQRVESREWIDQTHRSINGRNYAERFYRNSAATSLR